MSLNKFQSILANLHLKDKPTNYALHNLVKMLYIKKLGHYHDVCQENVLFAYKTNREISFDEACCPFKGQLQFKLYIPEKPNRFLITLLEISEAYSGYILGYDIYIWKEIQLVLTIAMSLIPVVQQPQNLLVWWTR